MALSQKKQAYVLLIAASLIWGLTYPIAFTVGDRMSAWGFCGLRFVSGSLVLLPLAYKWRALKPPQRSGGPNLWLWGGAVGGLLLAFGMGLQFYGLVRSTAGKAGFISGLYVAMTPVMSFVLGYVPRPRLWLGLAVAMLGLYFLSMPAGAPELSGGDLYLLAADVFWAAQVVWTAWLARKVNTWLFIAAQSVSCAVVCLFMAAVTGGWPSLAACLAVWPQAAWGVFASGLAYYCQTQAQNDVAPTPAALIMLSQALVAAVAGVVFLGEIMTGRMIFGATLILAGVLVAQLAGFRNYKNAGAPR